MIYIGIDPGKGGGIAMVNETGAVVLATKMPATEREILDVFTSWVPRGAMREVVHNERRAILELVRSSPQMGVVSAFTFGQGLGALRMALTAARIPYDEVTPGKWQMAMGCRSGGDKNITKRRAQELFPDVTVTHALADALLLAEYGRRLERHLYPSERKHHGEEANTRSEEGHPEDEGTEAPVAARPRGRAKRSPRQPV